jgi:hypothetical protein
MGGSAGGWCYVFFGWYDWLYTIDWFYRRDYAGGHTGDY